MKRRSTYVKPKYTKGDLRVAFSTLGQVAAIIVSVWLLWVFLWMHS